MSKGIILPLILTAGLVLTSVANAGNLNLVGWYKFDEDSGNTAVDSSGYGYDGTLIGATCAPTRGKLKGAVSFDGSAINRVEISIAGMKASAGTVALWARLAEPQSKQGRNGYRFLFGYCSKPNRVQLYMDDNDTQLDLGLGDKHRRHENIMNLSTETWYHIALTWDGSNYVVYVDSGEKATGTYAGLTGLPSVGDIGNNGDESGQAFHGLIDDVAIFDHVLSKEEVAKLYSLSVESFILEPVLLMLFGEAKEAEAIVKKQRPQEAVTFLEEKIAEYEQWREKNPNDIGFFCKALSFDLYFLLAKAKETAGAPTQDVIAAYKQLVSRLIPNRPNSVSALLWLFENVPAGDYIAAVKKCVHSSNVTSHNIHYIAKNFESSGNWPAFELFLDAVFSEAEDPVASAKLVECGLSENGTWKKKYLEYCKGKSQLAEYVFEKDCEAAEEYAAKGNFKKAAEVYGDIVKSYGPGKYKLALEFKVCECLFRGGEYQSAISALDRFIAKNKATNRSLAEEAMLMKGRCYIQLGEIDKASDEFLTLTVEYPEAKQAPAASFFMGYCYMLQGQFKEATDALNLVVQEYPQSDYADKARAYLARIENMTD